MPAGYRAVWPNRHKLAVAKLAGRVPQGATIQDLAALLMSSNGDRATDEFIEGHIFRGFNRQAVEPVLGSTPSGRHRDARAIKAIIRRLEEDGQGMDRGLIESAVLFGQIDTAVCWQGGERLVFGLDETRAALEPSHTQIGLILDCGAEAEALEGRPFTLDDVCRALIDSSLRQDALRAMLMGMDPDLEDDTRLYAIGDAEETLAAKQARDFVRHRFLGCPFPDEADLDGALRLALDLAAKRAAELYGE